MLDQTMMQVVLPMMPVLQQQGATVDLVAYLKAKAEMQNMPVMNEIIKGAGPMEEPPNENLDIRKPSTTTREYVRKSGSTRTRGGTANAMMAGLSGGMK